MNGEYIVNGVVQRDKIAIDIEYRKLKGEAIERLCREPQIKAAFIGSSYKDKKPRRHWNNAYLDLLTFAVVAESFNRDYLLHLDEVADFVSKKAGFKKALKAGGVILLLIGATVAAFKCPGVKQPGPSQGPGVDLTDSINPPTPEPSTGPERPGPGDDLTGSTNQPVDGEADERK